MYREFKTSAHAVKVFRQLVRKRYFPISERFEDLISYLILQGIVQFLYSKKRYVVPYQFCYNWEYRNHPRCAYYCRLLNILGNIMYHGK